MGSLVCVISLIDLHNPQKEESTGRGDVKGRREKWEVKWEEERERNIKRRMEN